MTETATTTPLSVQGALDALQAERNREWSAERLAAHQALRQGLEATAARQGFVKAGDRVAPFTLPEVDGGEVVLDDLLATGPVVLIFFRFAGCPACNAALPAYNAALAPELAALGAHLVAVSPQASRLLGEIKRRHSLAFKVASDPGAAIIGRLGIGFAPDELARERSKRDGTDLGATLGTGSWTLPYPTVVVIDRDGIVRFADVHPDWMIRTEAATVLEVVRDLV